MNNVAWILATHPDPAVRHAEEALQFAQRAVARTGRADPYLLDTLAAACASAGQYDRAVEAARKALDLLAGSGQESVTEKIRSRLERYEQGQPYREKSIP